MTDLYALLGVERTATPAAINAAWKRKAKLAHPDRTGGDAGAMAALNRARDVLLDPVTRERYDLGGDEAVANASQAETAAREILRHLAEQLIDQAIENSREDSDPLAVVLRILTDGKRQQDAQIRKMTDGLATLKKAKGRIRRKTGTGENIFERLIDDKLAGLDTALIGAGRQIAAFDEALRMLDELEDTRKLAARPEVSGYLSGRTFTFTTV
jgi:curved DNA-binding protein CbpA